MKRVPDPAVFALAVPARRPTAEDAPKGDLGKLQGTWTAKVGPEKNIPIAITIKGNAVSLKVTTPDGGDFKTDGEIKIDEKAKPHKTIDWVEVHQPQRRRDSPRTSASTSSSTPTPCGVCSGGPGNERPTEFKAGEGGPPSLIVLNRKPAGRMTPVNRSRDVLRRSQEFRFPMRLIPATRPDPLVIAERIRSYSLISLAQCLRDQPAFPGSGRPGGDRAVMSIA